jgi:hypothetical protein
MAESTLSLTFEDLARSTAFDLGWRRFANSAEGLTSGQVANVAAANNAGYRDFLAAHDWPFKRPRVNFTLWTTATGTAAAGLTTTVTATTAKFFPSMIGHSIVFTAGSTYTITGYTSPTVITVNTTAAADSSKAFTITPTGMFRLPDDFGSLHSTTILFVAGNNDQRQITVTSEALVQSALQVNTNQARPTMAGVRPLTTDGVTGQRFDLCVHPIPEQNYVVNFRYEVHPNALTAGLYPYGGMKYAEVIRQACLAAAESMFNDHKQVRRQEYAVALRMAIADSNRHNGMERLGITRNREPFNRRRYGGYVEHDDLISTEAVTVHGVSYD